MLMTLCAAAHRSFPVYGCGVSVCVCVCVLVAASSAPAVSATPNLKSNPSPLLPSTQSSNASVICLAVIAGVLPLTALVLGPEGMSSGGQENEEEEERWEMEDCHFWGVVVVWRQGEHKTLLCQWKNQSRN